MKTEQPESNCWIIITPISSTKDAVVGYWEVGGGGKQTPMTYATQREAWKQIVEDQIWRFEEFIKDDRLPDGKVPEFLPKNTVCPCTLNPDRSITTESHGLLFDGIPRESDFSITMAEDLKWRAPLWNTDEVSFGHQEFSRDFVESVLDVTQITSTPRKAPICCLFWGRAKRRMTTSRRRERDTVWLKILKVRDSPCLFSFVKSTR